MRILSAFLTILLCISSAHAAAPKRVVSVGGEITEVIYALGKESTIVGVDTSSVYPAAANQLPKIGYMRALSAEGIVSLKPDVVLITKDAGPEPVLQQIRAAGIAVETIPNDYSVDGLAKKIAAVAKTLHAQGNALPVLQTIAQAAGATPAETPKKPAKVLYFMQHGSGSPVVAGQDTAIDSFIRLSGAENAAQGFTGYKPFNTEAVIDAKPDIILLSNNTADKKSAQTILEMPGIKDTPAGKNQKILVLDTLQIMAYGPRTPDAIDTLHRYLATLP